MRLFYYARVFFISIEFATLLLAYFIYANFSNAIVEVFHGIKLNEEAVKWVIAYPISITAWVFKEGITVLFPDERSSEALHKWPDYWKLKAHFNVGIAYAIIFGLTSSVVWLLNIVNTVSGAWLFGTCAAVLSINAFSFYIAKIQIKSALLHLNDDK
ncbi:TPA: hypothetical protein NJ327_000009 [Vibrio parahaemolyticus]|uniref:hypothetical protein n=1 Tax=Vibrio parahaemolyticus TaxID=670 RepID=UPI00387AF9FF|nr:hypothetical protein [Vibrio parahaemolyticus]